VEYLLERVVNTAYDPRMKGLNCPPREEPAAHQLVGRVKAYQGYDG